MSSNRAPSSLSTPLIEREWILLPELQGKGGQGDLWCGLSEKDGKLLGLVQWTRTRDLGDTYNNFCIGFGPEGIARLLTLAHVAVRVGKA